ncbi:MAG: hypothetical protein ACTSV7_01245 [Candidatus Baldrarchaeia archaeon]
MKTIAVSDETLVELKILKEKLSAKAYDDVIRFLLKKVKEIEVKEALKVLEMEDEEVDEILDVILERRKTWWKK